MPWKASKYGPVRGWQPFETEMLRGAMIAERDGDTSAIADCAELLCRSVSSVRRKSRELIAAESSRQALAIRTWLTKPVNLNKPLPPTIHYPTPTELMSGHGHKRPSHFRDALRGFA